MIAQKVVLQWPLMSKFQETWHAVRSEKQSNIIAGLDPAVSEIGHGEKGLAPNTDLRDWSLQFIEAVAPYVAGVKLNQAFFQGEGHRSLVKELVAAANEEQLITICDSKFADIGNTNDAWVYFNKSLGFDAITFAAYGGNVEEGIAAGHQRDLAVMTLGLMSNPEYKTEMNFTHPETNEPLWKNRVRRAVEANVDAIVVGGTYTTEDTAFMEFVELTDDSEVLYLIPGIGAQGGTVESFLASGIKPEKCMISSSRGVMFPSGSLSTPLEQADAAKTLRDSFNIVAYGN